MEKQFCVYILASAKRGTLYIGVTSNLVQRVVQHREKVVEGFTAGTESIGWSGTRFITKPSRRSFREKQLKRWNRLWKIQLVETTNSDWRDLFSEVVG